MSLLLPRKRVKNVEIIKFIHNKQLDTAEKYEYKPPVQSPINPPYKMACKLKADMKLQQETS